jgi:hypothetical protein
MSVYYTAEELEKLYEEVEKGTSLSELEEILGRSDSGISKKLQRLSQSSPEKWDGQKAAEYCKQYRKMHGEKLREKERRYREENRERIREKDRMFREKNKGRLREYRRKYQEEHRAELSEKKRRHYQEHRTEIREKERGYREQHIDEYRERERRYRDKNRERLREKARLRCKRRRIAGIKDVGYEIEDVSLDNRGGLNVKLSEDDVDMPRARIDFIQHVKEAMRRVRLHNFYDRLQLRSRGNSVYISFVRSEKEKEKLECFLRAYGCVLRN